jgi:hypothetical protein
LAEQEQKAIKEARDELLAPEKVDVTALQTSSLQESHQKIVNDIETQKLGEVIEDNKEYTEEAKKDKNRASLSQSSNSNLDVDSILDAPIKVDDILDKSEEELAKTQSSKQTTQSDLNKSTMMSLAGDLTAEEPKKDTSTET